MIAEACLAQPPALVYELPTAGLRWAPDGEHAGACPPPSGTEQSAGDLRVSADGPEGSGRYWTITARLGDRGVCFVASTVGWRTLRAFDGPLPWAADTDADGRPEVIAWASFPLDETESPAAQGLAPWVYELDGARLAFDETLTRTWAGRVADAYAKPLGDPVARETRARAQRALRDLAAGNCTITPR